MTIAGILKRSFQLIWRNILPFLVIALITGLMEILLMRFIEVYHFSVSPGSPKEIFKAFLSTQWLVIEFLSMLVFIPISVVLVHLSSEYFLGCKPTAAEVVRKLRTSFIPALGTFLLVTAWVGVPGLALGVGTYYSHRSLSVLESFRFPFEVLLWSSVAVLLLWWAYVALTYFIAIQTVVLEGKWGMHTLRRCRELMRVCGEKRIFLGNVARLAGLISNLALIGIGIGLIVGLTGLLSVALDLSLTSPWMKIFVEGPLSIVGAFVHLFGTVALTLFYHDIRNRGEAGNLPQGVST